MKFFKRGFLYIGALIVLGVGVGGSVGVVSMPSTASAACQDTFLGIPTWYRGLVNGDCEILSPETATGGDIGMYIWTIVFNGIEIALRLLGYIAIFFIIYGGFRFLTSAGAPEGRAAGMKIVTNAVIGFAIAIAAVAIVNFLQRVLIGTPSSETGVYAVDANAVITAALNAVYFIAGAVAVIMLVVSGLNYVTSAGDPQKATKARAGILYAVIGIIIIIFAATITSFIQGRLT